jgi:hypothetical protein
MKALYILDQREGGLVLYGHDLEDSLVETLVEEYQSQGKHAYSVDQMGRHGGPAEICEKCRRAGEKIAKGTLVVAQTSQNRAMAPPLEGGIGMVSAEVEAPSKPLPNLGPPIRKFFSLLPVVAALVLVGFGLVYFLSPEVDKNSNTLASRIATPSPMPSSTQVAQVVFETPEATLTLAPSPTLPLQPTASSIPEEEPVVVVQVTNTEVPACMDALSITAEHAGQMICITGEVYRAEQKDGVFSITFSKDWGHFYLLSYDRIWEDAKPGVCIQATGEIVLSGTIPVIVFGYHNDLSLCP